MKTITVILGTARPKRKSEWVFKFLCQKFEASGLKTLKIDVKDYILPYDGSPADHSYKDAISRSDAICFVFPEYNHSIPGQLKTLLDSEFSVYKGKLAVLASVSAGDFGGTRATEHLIPILTNFGMNVCGLHMHFPNVEKNFNSNGDCLDNQTISRVEEIIKQIINKLS